MTGPESIRQSPRTGASPTFPEVARFPLPTIEALLHAIQLGRPSAELESFLSTMPSLTSVGNGHVKIRVGRLRNSGLVSISNSGLDCSSLRCHFDDPTLSGEEVWKPVLLWQRTRVLKEPVVDWSMLVNGCKGISRRAMEPNSLVCTSTVDTSIRIEYSNEHVSFGFFFHEDIAAQLTDLTCSTCGIQQKNSLLSSLLV